MCLAPVKAYLVQTYYYPSSCTSSADCDRGQCCRGRTGQVIGMDTTLPPMTGICAGFNNNMQPLDDGCGCNCDRDFLCYREITGVCCAPYTCSDADYVRERQAFWKNCFSDPNCALPPVVRPPQDGTGLTV
ncbi:uncharacterized protein LOC110448513 isoform X2 [Mizuhopecten yessoensis]|uniref:uncharacterized protein LOC110448513 isoform X2 n=1 Tax=Mizuhopecten yessoensis TaxID=6573 RepID=UPI000B45760F|nr:uncharacterized protein LOC110448513 isoform X2 [Mizuhopecten yessoensis]